jgi:hypothetical protein
LAVVERVLQDLVDSLRRGFGEDLRSLTLFGSTAENRLRDTSDVNLIIVLNRFDRTSVDRVLEPLRVAQAAIDLQPMWILAAELPAAAEAFATKFADVARRHKILYGEDPFATLTIPRAATLARLRQVLLNQQLRLRGTYISRGLREEQLVRAIADATGPLRAAAATLLDLEGSPSPSPKEALERAAGAEHARTLDALSLAHRGAALPPGTSAATIFAILDLIGHLRARAEELAP